MPSDTMAHPDLETLFQTLLPFTQKFLGEYGGFNPWGAVMYSGGDIQWVGADNGEEFPPAEELIQLLAENFQQQSTRGVLRAAGMCYDVRVVAPGNRRNPTPSVAAWSTFLVKPWTCSCHTRRRTMAFNTPKSSVGVVTLGSSYPQAEFSNWPETDDQLITKLHYLRSATLRESLRRKEGSFS